MTLLRTAVLWLGLFGCLLALGCGQDLPPASTAWAPLSPVFDEASPARYTLTWKQSLERADGKNTVLGWRANISLRGRYMGASLEQAVEVVDHLPDGREVSERITVGESGRFTYVGKGVAGVGAMNPAAGIGLAGWLRARLRPVPPGGIPAQDATWSIRDAQDSLPVGVPLRLDLRVAKVEASTIQVVGTGSVLVDELPEGAAAKVAWVRSATRMVRATFTLSRKTGLVTSGEVRVELSSPAHWDGSETETRIVGTMTIQAGA